jgi:hypothetical protein
LKETFVAAGLNNKHSGAVLITSMMNSANRSVQHVLLVVLIDFIELSRPGDAAAGTGNLGHEQSRMTARMYWMERPCHRAEGSTHPHIEDCPAQSHLLCLFRFKNEGVFALYNALI